MHLELYDQVLLVAGEMQGEINHLTVSEEISPGQSTTHSFQRQLAHAVRDRRMRTVPSSSPTAFVLTRTGKAYVSELKQKLSRVSRSGD